MLGSSTFGSTWVKYKYFSYLQVQVIKVLGSSAAQIRSPGRQMRAINRPGDPECHRGWSGGRLINLSVLNPEFLPLLSQKINSIMKMWEMSTAIWWWFYSGLSVLNQSSYQCICLKNNHFNGVFVWFDKKNEAPRLWIAFLSQLWVCVHAKEL